MYLRYRNILHSFPGDVKILVKVIYTAAPLYRGPINRGNQYNAVVLCHPLLIKKKF